MSTDFETERFELTFEEGMRTAISAPTEIFVPTGKCPQGVVIAVSHGEFEVSGSLLFYHRGASRTHTVVVSPSDLAARLN